MELTSLIILGFTAAALVFGAIFGLIRGRNRALLRLILVIVSVVLAIVLREALVSTVMDFEIDDTSIHDLIAEELLNDETDIPEQLQDLIFTVAEIIIGLAVFFVIFFALRLITWIIIFPIAKIFVRKGEKKHPYFGALIGAIQGFVIAFIVCVPISGMIVEVDKLSDTKINGEVAMELPEEIGIEDYVDSVTCKFYSKAGGWFFDIISSAEDSNGNKITISDTCDIVTTVAGIANTVTDLTENIDSMSIAATPQEQITSIKNVGNSLIEIGKSVDNLSSDAKNIVENVMDSVKEMVSGEGEEMPPELEAVIDNIDINELDLVSVGEAMNGIATYIEKTNDEFQNTEPVTQEDVDHIVNGLANNTFILDIFLADSSEVPQIIVAEPDTFEMFESAVNNSSASEEHKETLRKMFGISSI